MRHGIRVLAGLAFAAAACSRAPEPDAASRRTSPSFRPPADSSPAPGLGTFPASGAPAAGSPATTPAKSCPPGTTRREGVPATGRYLYRVRSGDGAGAERALDVADYIPCNGGAQQVLTVVTKAQEYTRTVIAWTSDALLVLAQQRARGRQVAPMCDWEPDIIEARLPLAVGAEWTSEGECSTKDGAVQRRRNSGRIVGRDKRDVGGDSVGVFVIERRAETRTTAGPVLMFEVRESRDAFSERDGLVVESSGTSEVKTGDLPGRRTPFTEELRSLQPKEEE